MTAQKTIALKLKTGKAIEIDCSIDSGGRVFSVDIYGPGTFAGNAGLTDDESAEVDAAVACLKPDN